MTDRAQRRWRLLHSDGRVDQRLFVGGIRKVELQRLYPGCEIVPVEGDRVVRRDDERDGDGGDDA